MLLLLLLLLLRVTLLVQLVEIDTMDRSRTLMLLLLLRAALLALPIASATMFLRRLWVMDIMVIPSLERCESVVADEVYQVCVMSPVRRRENPIRLTSVVKDLLLLISMNGIKGLRR